MIDIAAIRSRFEKLSSCLDERCRRLFAAAEAQAAGWGGVTAVSAATGIARSTIRRGLAELRSGNWLCAGTHSSTGRWSQAEDTDAAGAPGGPSGTGAVGDPWRSRGGSVVGQPEPAPSCMRSG